MSLIKCIDCGRDVSSHAERCPNCGCPVSVSLSSDVSNESTLYDVVLCRVDKNYHLEAIRFVREVNSLDLSDAVKVIDALPQTIITGVPLSTAEDAKNKLASINCECTISETKSIDSTHTSNIDTIEKTNLFVKDKPITCPRCGSNQVTTGSRGFSIITGFLGSNKTVNRCGRCGYAWKP